MYMWGAFPEVFLAAFQSDILTGEGVGIKTTSML
jgi:hypothetical protein